MPDDGSLQWPLAGGKPVCGSGVTRARHLSIRYDWSQELSPPRFRLRGPEEHCVRAQGTSVTPLSSFSPSGPMCVQRGEVKSTDSSPTVSVVSLAPLLASCGALGQTWGLNPAESCPTTGLQLENILGTRSGWRAMGSIAFYLRRLFSSHRLRTQVMGFGTRRPH